MNPKLLYDAFKKEFDVVSILDTNTYIKEKSESVSFIKPGYNTLVVVGLAYPRRTIKHSETHLVPSFYTFGSDYHQVLKKRMKQVLDQLDLAYELNVDNHPYDERLAATLGGIGYFARNQLIINEVLGSYFFLGMAFLNTTIEHEIKWEIIEDCGSCTKCIEACPTGALSLNHFNVNRCLSYLNQSKIMLDESVMKANYALFGCDICQMVCPKNINKGAITHDEFKLSGKEQVNIEHLFQMSEREFKDTYDSMSYLWKGKTILMRNALMVLWKRKDKSFNDLILKSLNKYPSWYDEMAKKVLADLKE